MNKFVAAALLSLCVLSGTTEAQVIGNDPCQGAGDYLGTAPWGTDTPFSSGIMQNIVDRYSDDAERDTVSDADLMLTLAYANARWDAMFAVMTKNVDVCKMINTLNLALTNICATTAVYPSQVDETPAETLSLSYYSGLNADEKAEVFRSNKYAFQFNTAETGAHPATIPLEVTAFRRMFDGISPSSGVTRHAKTFVADSFISYSGGSGNDVPVEVQIIRRTCLQTSFLAASGTYMSIINSDNTDANDQAGTLMTPAEQDVAWDAMGITTSEADDIISSGAFKLHYTVIVRPINGDGPAFYTLRMEMFRYTNFFCVGTDPFGASSPSMFAGRITGTTNPNSVNAFTTNLDQHYGLLETNCENLEPTGYRPIHGAYGFFNIGGFFVPSSSKGSIAFKKAGGFFPNQFFTFCKSDDLVGNLGSE